MRIQDIVVNENQTIKESMRVIDKGGLGLAIILDDKNQYLGVITDGDIRRAILKGLNLNESIKTITNTSSIYVNENWKEDEIRKILGRDEVRLKKPQYGSLRIPVINNNRHPVDMLFASENKIMSLNKTDLRIKDKISIAKNILIVGGAGYLGSVLCKKLIQNGYKLRVLDNLTYGDQGLVNLYEEPNFEFVKGDMRNIKTVVDAVKGMDAVIHLAAIVGDPASAINPEETIEINYLGTKMLAEVCKYSQINRFIFASTCSVYGTTPNSDIRISETSELNPVSLYAEMKLKSEQGILELEDENFAPTIFRMATLYGLSPRMRFDLVVNILTIKALKEKKFTIFGGDQWRPLLHVDDAAEAYVKCLEQSIGVVKGQIFNVGSNHENYIMKDVGEVVKDILPDSEMNIDEKNVDKRNYNVSFDKIKKKMGFDTKHDVKFGVNEIIDAVNKKQFNDYQDKKYSNYKFLLESF